MEVVVNLLLGEIEIFPQEKYSSSLKKAEDILGEVDLKDAPFLACALAKNCAIWSNDKDFQKQNVADVYTTRELKRKID